MPNWVRSKVELKGELSKEQKDVLSGMKERGICDFLIPMPSELDGTTSPTRKMRVPITDKDLIVKIEASVKNEKDVFSGGTFERGYVDGVYYFQKDGVWTSPSIERYYTDEEAIIHNKESKGDEFSSMVISESQSKSLIDRFGCDNWYDWKRENYGTKWGDSSLVIDGNKLTYQTAWAPLGGNVMKMFGEIFPNFDYAYEEEQGWGARFTIKDGEIVESEEWEASQYNDE